MNFLHPGLAVAALCAAALPIVLPLLLRRPRVTPWPSTMLLRLAMEKVRRRRRLERWLLLTLRALGIGLIGNLKLGHGLRIEDALTVVNGARPAR